MKDPHISAHILYFWEHFYQLAAMHSPPRPGPKNCQDCPILPRENIVLPNPANTEKCSGVGSEQMGISNMFWGIKMFWQYFLST